MSAADTQSTSKRPSGQAGLTEMTPLLRPERRLSFAEVALGQVASSERAEAPAAAAGAERHDDEEFVDAPGLETQAGDVEIVAGTRPEGGSQSSIFKARIEQEVNRADPGFMRWLGSANGLFMQATLCFLLVLIQAESSVWTELAKTYKPQGAANSEVFNSATIGVVVSIVSVLICIPIAVAKGELGLLLNRDTGSKLLKYTIPGCGFQVTQWLNLMALGLMSADVQKVLDQCRLLVIALITLGVFGRNQSAAGWNSLLVVSFAALSYAEMKKALQPARTPAENDQFNDTYSLGLLIVMISVVAQSALCVLCEKVLKDDKGMSFYIQKFFLEVPGIAMGVFLGNIGNPLLYNWLKSRGANGKVLGAVGGKGELWEFFRDPLKGWNEVVVFAFVLLLAKSWLSGLVVKQLNAIIKQLCAVLGVGILYFVSKVHICPRPTEEEPAPFLCISNLSTIQLQMVVMDLCVLFSVFAYTLAGRDKQRTAKLMNEVKEASAALAQSKV